MTKNHFWLNRRYSAFFILYYSFTDPLYHPRKYYSLANSKLLRIQIGIGRSELWSFDSMLPDKIVAPRALEAALEARPRCLRTAKTRSKFAARTYHPLSSNLGFVREWPDMAESADS